jgi:hypothetical protein
MLVYCKEGLLYRSWSFSSLKILTCKDLSEVKCILLADTGTRVLVAGEASTLSGILPRLRENLIFVLRSGVILFLCSVYDEGALVLFCSIYTILTFVLARTAWILRFLDNSHWHTTVGMTPLDEWSARRWDLSTWQHNIHKRQTSVLLAGFEPAIPAIERP